MTQVIYDKWLNGSLIKHEITEDENGHSTWRIKDNWIGLTDDEFNSILKDCWIFGLGQVDEVKFARAIEQALKEKNT